MAVAGMGPPGRSGRGLPDCPAHRVGANEAVTTLLMNFVANDLMLYLIYQPWKDPGGSGQPESRPLAVERGPPDSSVRQLDQPRGDRGRRGGASGSGSSSSGAGGGSPSASSAATPRRPARRAAGQAAAGLVDARRRGPRRARRHAQLRRLPAPAPPRHHRHLRLHRLPGQPSWGATTRSRWCSRPCCSAPSPSATTASS